MADVVTGVRPGAGEVPCLIPESSTPTVTPAPVSPSRHAAGAPICGTLTSSRGFATPSSHTFPTSGEPVNQCQNSLARARSRVTAAPLMLGSCRTVVAAVPEAALEWR
jgi:hypothetical protein